MPQSDGNDPAACVNVASAFRIAMWIPSLSEPSLLPVPTLWMCWRYLTCIPRFVGTVFVACTIVVAALRIAMWILSLCRKSCVCCKVVAPLGDCHVIASCCKLTLTPVLKLWQCLWFSRVFLNLLELFLLQHCDFVEDSHVFSWSLWAVFVATLSLRWRFWHAFFVCWNCVLLPNLRFGFSRGFPGSWKLMPVPDLWLCLGCLRVLSGCWRCLCWTVVTMLTILTCVPSPFGLHLPQRCHRPDDFQVC